MMDERRWKDNIKMVCKNVGYSVVNWVRMVRDGDK